MNELLAELEPESVEFLLQEILYGFYVVVGNRFYLLDLCGVGLGEIAVDVAESLESGVVHAFKLRQRNLAQGYEIFHLHLHAVADEGEFRKIPVEFLALRAIPAVDGADCCEGCQLHYEND